MHCNKNYEVTTIGGGVPGGKELEDITCPYCGHTYRQMTSSVFRTHALPVEKQ